MSATTLAVDGLLAIAVGVAVACAIGLLVMRDLYERLHYLAPVAGVSGPCIALALVLAEGMGQAALKAVLIALVLCVVNPVLSHAIARAARIRTFGHWAARPESRAARVRGHRKAGRRRA